MPKKRISLGQRYQRAFGYIAKGASDRLKTVGFKKKENLSLEDSDLEVYVESDGSFEEMTIVGKEFELLFASTIGNAWEAGRVFAPPPMITFDRSKTITVTPIDDSDDDENDNAVVVERYNSGQWDIKMQGILIDMDNHIFPKQQLVALREMFEENNILEVRGDFWDALKIKSIYIESLGVATVQGFEDTLQFTLQCYSINPVEFFLKKQVTVTAGAVQPISLAEFQKLP